MDDRDWICLYLSIQIYASRAAHISKGSSNQRALPICSPQQYSPLFHCHCFLHRLA